MLTSSVSGIVVSIAAFQAVDPGSIPGQRSLLEVMTDPLFSLALRRTPRTHRCTWKGLPLGSSVQSRPLEDSPYA